MFINSFTCKPIELSLKDTYVEIFKNPSPREITSILKYHNSGRFGVVDKDVWFWRGDVFHGTVMRELWNLNIFKQWTDWNVKLYFEKNSCGIIWSTTPSFDVIKYIDAINIMESCYPRMRCIRSGTTFNDLYVRLNHSNYNY